MRIVTVNVPEEYVEAIKKLVGTGKEGLYPSRSELIRVAVRRFIIKELQNIKNMIPFKDEPEIKDFDDKKYVRIPIEETNKKGEIVRKFQTYKIIKRA